MGACGSSEAAGGGAAPQATEEEQRTSRSIDKMLRDEEKRLAREVKVRAHSLACTALRRRMAHRCARFTLLQMLLLGELPLAALDLRIRSLSSLSVRSWIEWEIYHPRR